jgi:hypothetical protein
VSMNNERRVSKLEQSSSPPDLPWISLIQETNQALEEVFKESGHPGKMEDYSIICHKIVDPPSARDDLIHLSDFGKE